MPPSHTQTAPGLPVGVVLRFVPQRVPRLCSPFSSHGAGEGGQLRASDSHPWGGWGEAGTPCRPLSQEGTMASAGHSGIRGWRVEAGAVCMTCFLPRVVSGPQRREGQCSARLPPRPLCPDPPHLCPDLHAPASSCLLDPSPWTPARHLTPVDLSRLK